MKDRRLLALPVLVFALSCGRDQPMGPGVPTGSSEVIVDGANGPTGVTRNKDFFFLPPLVAPPFRHPDFELGDFNNALASSLRIEICLLDVTTGLPGPGSACVGDPIKEFGQGSLEPVKLVNLPRRQWGWWSLFGLPPDGFYYVLWNTGKQNPSLRADRFYRIKVLLPGLDQPLLGYADVDPMSNLRQWRHALTGEVIQLVNGILLPIPFRVENSAFCVGGTECVSATVHNVNPDGSGRTIVRVETEDDVPIAGIQLTDGWAPAGVQSAVFTITRVNTGINNVEAGTQTEPCHARPFPLQQFDACFNYSTIPDLGGAAFRARVVAAVCIVILDQTPPDTRVPWVQLWSSEPGEEGDVPKPLVRADASAILTNPDGENCETQEVPIPIIGDNSSNPLTRFANAGWRTLTRGMGRVFGVKTAYAVDFGLGGILDDISNIGPALTAEFRPFPPAVTPVPAGTPITSTVRIVGTKIHDGSLLDDVVTPLGKTQGIPGLPVEFTLFRDGAPVSFSGTATPAPLTTTTDPSGFATVNWTPSTAGTYSLRATGQAKGGPITYSATVTAPLPIVFASSWPGPSSLYTVQIDANGVDTRIGQIATSTGVQLTITDIALLPDGSLLGVQASQLYSINRESGVAVARGGALPFSGTVGLAADANGVLYAGTSFGELWRDAGSGWVHQGTSVVGGFSGDLAFAPNGTLYGSLVASGVTVLASIIPSTGAATVISPPTGLGFSGVFGLTFVGANLYGFTTEAHPTGGGRLLLINPTTGTATAIRSLAFGAGGAAALRRVDDFD